MNGPSVVLRISASVSLYNFCLLPIEAGAYIPMSVNLRSFCVTLDTSMRDLGSVKEGVIFN